jgi:hypothetical protein
MDDKTSGIFRYETFGKKPGADVVLDVASIA